MIGTSVKSAVGFAEGIKSVFDGLGMLMRERSLRRLATVPIIIDTLFMFIIGAVLVYFFADLRNLVWAEPAISAWYDYFMVALWWLFNVFFAIASVLIGFVLVVILGNIVASPFNDAIAGRTLRILAKEDSPEGGAGFWVLIKESFRTLAEELLKLLIFLLLQIPTILLWLIPGVGGMLSTIWSMLVSWWFFALEFLDYPLGRNGYTLRGKTGWIRQHLAASLGFGAAASVLMFIPGINLMFLPVCVVGATLLYWKAK